ncbi:MAG: septum formation initiator family protein [Lactobacillales bacterium]|nr:septum formation initiator family protein [Lactobacillales bacterium]
MKKKSNVTTLNNEYTQGMKVEEQEKYRELIFLRRRLGMFTFLSLIIFSFIAIQLKINYDKAVKANMVREDILRKCKDLKKEEKRLKKAENLLKDEDYVAKLARSKYYYSKDGEQIYIFPKFEQDGVWTEISRKEN